MRDRLPYLNILHASPTGRALHVVVDVTAKGGLRFTPMCNRFTTWPLAWDSCARIELLDPEHPPRRLLCAKCVRSLTNMTNRLIDTTETLEQVLHAQTHPLSR